MLAAQGADLLGVLEDIESYWRFDGEDLYDQAKLKRIFRSIGTPARSTEPDDESRHILEEATDVLAMTQPFFMHNGPHGHQLTPTAHRLLGEDLIGTRRRVTQKDFETLLNILIRLNLFKENWGLSFPFGGFEPSEPGTDELANILANKLECGQRQEDLGFDQVNQIKHLLVSISFLKMLSRVADYCSPTCTFDFIRCGPFFSSLPRRTRPRLMLEYQAIYQVRSLVLSYCSFPIQ